MISSDSTIFVAGHRGMVGSALVRRLEAGGYRNIITADRSELDLLDQAAVRAFMNRERPTWVIVAAAKVGRSHEKGGRGYPRPPDANTGRLSARRPRCPC